MRGKIKRAKAGDIMTSNVVTVENDKKLIDVVKIMTDKKIGSVIVENLSHEPSE